MFHTQEDEEARLAELRESHNSSRCAPYIPTRDEIYLQLAPKIRERWSAEVLKNKGWGVGRKTILQTVRDPRRDMHR